MLPRRYQNVGYNNDWAHHIDVGQLLDYINIELRQNHIYLSDAEIRRFLAELQEVARIEENYFGNDGEEELLATLKEELAVDLRKVDHIVDEERHPLVAEWCVALRQLEGLVPEDKWYKAFRQVSRLGPPLFEEWRRPNQPFGGMLRFFQDRNFYQHGREPIHMRPMIAPFVRRRSLPIIPRARISEMPPYPRTGYNSPGLGPMYGFHEVNLRQELHQLDMARLRRDMDNFHRPRF
ncbi:hypothetical protein E8E13_006575 [Curvularia kusanoi]|uniref:Uncharacterized protein n=1 Tax=Curvularia kusanoi TaxID=90978 RepID=A0A9P4W964_CURKU|nr:hypothetical protein E8E13_006575 [Curvularia kusanoi]